MRETGKFFPIFFPLKKLLEGDFKYYVFFYKSIIVNSSRIGKGIIAEITFLGDFFEGIL